MRRAIPIKGIMLPTALLANSKDIMIRNHPKITSLNAIPPPMRSASVGYSIM
jgi:hypothetical protein